MIDSIPNDKKLHEKYSKFDNIWSCAASWHPFKRLKCNIDYFLNFSNKLEKDIYKKSIVIQLLKINFL